MNGEPLPWKTEYAVAKQESRDPFEWHDDEADADESARLLSSRDPDNVYVVIQMKHYETVYTERSSYSGGYATEKEDE